MIKTIFIKNFILIDELLMDFSKGFNVFLGETGAGKSIIIKAIDTVLGQKTSKDVLKDPNFKALIEIVFLDNNEELTISREISNTGTKCRINGMLVSLDEIKEQRAHLIDIHTQFQTYTYIQQKYHIKLLDSYIISSNKEFEQLLEKQESEFSRYNKITLAFEKLQNESQTTKDKIEFLKFQINELETADIKENEEEDLNKELEILSNIQELKELSFGSYWALNGEDNSIIEVLRKISFNISKIKDYDSNMSEVDETFFGALENLKDVSSSLRNYSESLEDDPKRLNEINERLEIIEKMKRKYGDIFDSYERFKKELEELEKSSYDLCELSDEIKSLHNSIQKNCEKISAIRHEYSEKLSQITESELKKLEFECPKFSINIKNCPINSQGFDYVEFMLTTNKGKDLEPLIKVASGGEISRVMLALKSVFASSDKIQTVIFDEIDTGISGKTSVAVANKIKDLSHNIQVFAITHQPIIASVADCSYLISKMQTSNDTKISAKKLNTEEKIETLAVMSSGVLDEKSIQFARELTKENI